MHRDGFFITGESWLKFNTTFPSVTFSKFWDIKLRLYEKRKAAAIRFFAKFQCDPERHAKILADRTLHREIRRIQRSSDVPYVPPEGLKKLKLEPFDNEFKPLEFMYHVPQ
jgi:hypothetical protein